MSEILFFQLVTGFDLLFVGGLLFVLPQVARRGLLFGAYVGEERGSGAEAAALTRSWRRGIVVLTLAAFALAIGLGLLGRPLAGLFGALALQLVPTCVLYLQLHRAARELAPARPLEPLPAPAGALEPGSSAIPIAALLLCLAAGSWGVVDAALHWPDIPERVPTHFGVNGEPDAWSAKSFASVFALPLMNLVMGGMVAGMGLLIAWSPLALRREPTEQELEAQRGFRAATVNMLAGTALLCTAMMGVIAYEGLRTALGERAGLGSLVWWFGGALLVFVLVYTGRMLAYHGQGGAHREGAAASQPLTDGLADDAHWKAGVFYVNKADPAVLVEKRFGVGYTLNFGNPLGLGMMLFILLLLAAVTGLALWAAAG